jgi:cytochrome d ubiquinol oxidase subunit II
LILHSDDLENSRGLRSGLSLTVAVWNALLGAGWLVYRDEGPLREWAYARIPWLVGGVVAVLGLAFIVSITVNAGAVAQSNLENRYWGVAFPTLAIAALLGVLGGVRARRDGLPFLMSALFFVASYITLAVMFWPYMIPYSITVADAAAPDASLGFIFYCGVIVLPVIAIYSTIVYYIFRGKARTLYN